MLIMSFDIRGDLLDINRRSGAIIKAQADRTAPNQRIFMKAKGENLMNISSCPVLVCWFIDLFFFVDISSPYLTEFNGRYPSGKVSGRALALNCVIRARSRSTWIIRSLLIRRCDIVYGDALGIHQPIFLVHQLIS